MQNDVQYVQKTSGLFIHSPAEGRTFLCLHLKSDLYKVDVLSRFNFQCTVQKYDAEA